MKLLFLIFLMLASSNSNYPQVNNFSLGNISASIENSTLRVLDKDKNLIYTKKFFNPSGNLIDLDNDGNNELMIIDSVITSKIAYYTAYIFAVVDSFILADSIYSGETPPYQTSSDEVNGIIIITGNPFFDHYNIGLIRFSPINCWKYDEGEVYIDNEEEYDLFLNENDLIIEYLDHYFKFHDENCTQSREVLGAITSAYANFVNAGEKSMADKFITKYYHCLDFKNLKAEMDKNIVKE